MKKLLSLFLALIILTLTITSLFSCGGNEEAAKTDEELIIERVDEFLTAYNNGDWEGVMACLEPETRNAMQALINVLGALAGSATGVDIDLRDLFSLGISTESGDFMKLGISDCKMISSNTAVVTAKMNMCGTTEKIYITLVKEDSEWLIKDMSDKKPYYDNVGDDTSNDDNSNNESGGNIDNGGSTGSGNSSANPEETSDITITSIYKWTKDGNVVEFIMEGEEYKGVVNSDGEIYFYSSALDDCTIKDWGNGGYYYYSDEYVIFSKDGKEIAKKSDGDFDEIVAFGNGLVLVYKNTGNMLNAESSYGIIDTENGCWIKEMRPGIGRNKIWGSNLELKDLGDGFYLVDNYVLSFSDENFSGAKIDGDIIAVENGTIYGINMVIKDLLDSTNTRELPEYASVNFAKGEKKELPEFNRATSKILVNHPGWGGYPYLSIYNIAEEKSYEYTDITAGNIDYVFAYGDTVLFRALGADGKYYLVALDDKAQMKFEPINIVLGGFSSINFYEGIADYYDRSSNTYCAIDTEGNRLATSENGYTYFRSFLNGLAIVEKEGESFFINKEGKRIALTIYAE